MSERPVEQADAKRAAELIVAYMADTPEGDDRYEHLVRHTLAEFDADTILAAVIALLVGTCKGLGPMGTSILGDSLIEMLNRPTEEQTWLTR